MYIQRKNEQYLLTPSELREAFEEQNLLYRMEDVRDHAKELGVDWYLDDSSVRMIAETFIAQYDCNLPENNQIDSFIKEFVQRADRVFKGYVYDRDGFHDSGHYFAGTYENIASFIIHNKEHRTIITDSMDNWVVTSLPGGFLDRFGELYRKERDDLLKVLLPMQYGEREPAEIEYLYEENMEMEW